MQKNKTSEIGTFSFDNLTGLIKDEKGYYMQTATSGEALSVNTEIKKGFLEDSAVFYANEVSKALQTQRMYQLNSRMIVLSDEVTQTINNLR